MNHKDILTNLSDALSQLSNNSSYPYVEIGTYIEPYDERNDDGLLDKESVVGLSTSKEIIKTKANLEGTNISSYKLFKPQMLAYVPDTSRRGDKVSLGMNKTTQTYLLSSISEIFKCKDGLLPEFLYMWLIRTEFDRYARYHSWGTTRETFSFDEMKKVKIPLPPICMQEAIVNIYRCAEEAKRIAEEADRLSKEICPALMQHLIYNSEN